MSEKSLTEDELKKIMPLVNEAEINSYLKTRIECFDLIKDCEADVKNYYQNLIGEIDLLFNDNDPELIEGVEEMMGELISKNPKDPIQLLSFCSIESGNYSIRLSAFENVNNDDHSQQGEAIATDVANYYLEDLDDVFSDIFYNEYVDEYDLELDDFWDLPNMKKIMQIKRCIKESLDNFDLSTLNIKYPLYVYLDFEETDHGSGILVTKIDS